MDETSVASMDPLFLHAADFLGELEASLKKIQEMRALLKKVVTDGPLAKAFISA